MLGQIFQKQACILIVDDNPINLRIFGHILREENYLIVEARDGHVALELLETISPDLVLLDVMMPGIDGFEVCQTIKSNPIHSAVPVIFLSARNDVSDIVKGFESGAIDYLAKPFNKSELLVRLKTHLDFKFTRDELVRTTNHLMELNELKNRLFSIIGHDLRSPLSNVKMTVDFIQRKIINPSGPEFDETIQDLAKSTDEMFFLLENLFGWARSQSGVIDIAAERIVLRELLESVFLFFLNKLKDKQIVINNQVDPSVHVWADASMIKSVLRNLISNAIKYSFRGGQIDISAHRSEGQVQINVIDSGVGIDSEIQPQLFSSSKLCQTYGTENESGSGIGLMLCKDFATKNNGNVEFESIKGQGSRFSLTLPIN
ncbi:MAG: hybrid sensor histidine kinase/response regulator [Prolixibacteraceae bacterium]|nr:hybrid sensor histidine kinase/response regulator [Prolixibacteraceae bacterium]